MPDADTDRLTMARIAAVTGRHARGKALTADQETAALAELAEVADGRVDLPAQQAGLAIGGHEHDVDAPVYLQIAQLCIQASADIALIPCWIEEGRRRATAPKQPPSTGLAAPAPDVPPHRRQLTRTLPSPAGRPARDWMSAARRITAYGAIELLPAPRQHAFQVSTPASARPGTVGDRAGCEPRRPETALTTPERVAVHAPDQRKRGPAHHDRGPVGGRRLHPNSCPRRARMRLRA